MYDRYINITLAKATKTVTIVSASIPSLMDFFHQEEILHLTSVNV